MEITIPLFREIALKISDGRDGQNQYPTSALQKGLLLMSQNHNLAEEAVGFGVPIVKLGLTTIFPGAVELTCEEQGPHWRFKAIYAMNLTEKIAGPRRLTLDNTWIYMIKNSLAAVMRRVVFMRSLLTAVSSGLRWFLQLKTTFGPAEFSARIPVHFDIDGKTGTIHVEVDTGDLGGHGITEVVVMNEQGAHYFDCYEDSSGLKLSGKKTGMWDLVTAERASFTSDTHAVRFTLAQVPGARLFRGSELVGKRLAWSGFGYTFAPSLKNFRYSLKIEKKS
ncbi:MAG: hypothetical protein PHC61_02390 [Chitinivibrionales bacterium]|nr:hypothetical protein [Chitinivibrionales bacterium]